MTATNSGPPGTEGYSEVVARFVELSEAVDFLHIHGCVLRFLPASGRRVLDAGAGAAWKHDFDVEGRRFAGRFAGAPGSTLRLEGASIDRHAAVAGAGLILSRGRLTLGLDG